MKISILISLLIIVLIFSGVFFMDKINRQNAMLNEYEYVLASTWTDEQKCRDQLGVFYEDEK